MDDDSDNDNDRDTLSPLVNLDADTIGSSTATDKSTIRPRRPSGSTASQGFQNLRRARTRKFSSSSMDELLPPRFEPSNAPIRGVSEEEFEQPSTSKKLLVFFAVPVVAGLFFDNGAAITVDLILIALACLCLYWSVEMPWQWYFYARTMSLEESPSARNAGNTAVDSGDEFSPAFEKQLHETLGPKTSHLGPGQENPRDKPEWRTLHNYELYALASCFLAPPAVAYLMHCIRHYLARPDSSAIENVSLVLFVIAAELPPLNQSFKLLFAHTMYLQRVVASYDMLEDDKVKELKATVAKTEEDSRKAIEEMSRSVADLQARLVSPSPPSGTKTPPSMSNSASDITKLQSTQAQVDALNRAVRRYEKRAVTQAIVYEARIKDLEAKINDALTLAAAASRTSSTHSSGMLSWILDGFGALAVLPVHFLHFLFTWPFSAINSLYAYLLGPRQRKKKTTLGGSKAPDSIYVRRQRIDDR